MRDLKMIGYKLRYVMLPKSREEGGKELRNCKQFFLLKKIYIYYQGDLWGPLLLCLLLALTLGIHSSAGSSSLFGK